MITLMSHDQIHTSSDHLRQLGDGPDLCREILKFTGRDRSFPVLTSRKMKSAYQKAAQWT